MAKLTYSQTQEEGRYTSSLLGVLASGQNPDGTGWDLPVSAPGGLPVVGQASAWSITARVDNGAATVTRAAEAGRHFVTAIHASFSAAAIRLLTLSEGGTIVANFDVHNQRDVVLPSPREFAAGTAVSATLAASGALGVLGTITVFGYTRA